MRKIAANYIFPVTSSPIKNGIVVVDDNGVIIDLIDTGGVVPEIEKLEFYNGIIVPGFVNAHVHLELSHLRNKVDQNTGMVGFVKQLQTHRNIFKEEAESAIQYADREMKTAGIVAAGDISNDQSSFNVKSTSKIIYHTFIEAYTTNAMQVVSKFDFANQLKETAKEKYSLLASIVPHSIYSVHPLLMQKIAEKAKKKLAILSLHFLESSEELNCFSNKQGDLYDFVKGITGNDCFLDNISSVEDYLCKYIYPDNNLLLIHNNQIDIKQIEKISSYFKNVFWVLCPNSNKYIHNQLPPVNLFYQSNQKVAIGTDSLASNKRISILEELKTLSANFEIPLTELIKWATINGAEALNLNQIIGSIELGKKPGLNLIQGIDFYRMSLTSKSIIKVLV